MNHGKNSKTTSNQPGLFQLLQCLPWNCLASRKAGQPLVPRGSDAGVPEPCCWASCGRQQQEGQGTPRQEGWPQLQLNAQCHPPLLKGANSAFLLLSPPPRARPLRFSQHPTCFVDLGQNTLELHSHLQHWYFCYFFQCFLVHSDCSIMKYNLYTRSILQLTYYEAESHNT